MFINSHPETKRSLECNNLIDDLRERLEKKSFDIAKGYFHREKFSSAVTSFNVMLGEYPDSPYREEAMMLRFKSAYELAKNSIENLESDRYKEAATAYLEFNDAFPESLFLKEVESVYKKIQAFSEKEL